MTGAVLLATYVVGTSFMCGLGWVVQIVHYPLFDRVDRARWTEFHAEHSRRIGLVVGLPWAMQGLGSIGLLLWRPPVLPLTLVLLAVVLAGLTVVATVLLAIPEHERLGAAFDVDGHARLVATNWVRTIAWTLGTIVALVMVVDVTSR